MKMHFTGHAGGRDVGVSDEGHSSSLVGDQSCDLNDVRGHDDRALHS